LKSLDKFILKNANFLPEEAVLLKEIAELEEKSRNSPDPQQRSQIQKEIQSRQLKYNLLTERFARHRK
jgi:hypothetical protein